jgi:hypothetical protein
LAEQNVSLKQWNLTLLPLTGWDVIAPAPLSGQRSAAMLRKFRDIKMLALC